ncbi:MAG TPA: HAD family hydrolase [Pirellulales bacterium]|jgi:HAD superfamily hydrolase (TIGR01509 family)|nr:HAD family hydrolase [Pirellulales bacterium]
MNRPKKERLTPLDGLIFDMGDVLYDATVWRRWLVQLLHRMGLHTRYRSFFKVWDEEYLDDVHRGRREHGEAFQAFLLAVGLSRGQIDEVVAASHARKREIEAGTRALPGVRETIARLSQQGVVLSVLSDSEYTSEVLHARLVKLGLGGRFTAAISSFDLERTKPDPVCYRAALTAMGMRADQVAFVGHDADELAGARAVRLRTLAFNFEPGAKADSFLSRFEELLDYVGRAARDTEYQGAA